MQRPKRRSPILQVDFKGLVETFRFARRYRKHPEELDLLIATVKERGASDNDIATFRMFFTASRDILNDDGAGLKFDQYLMAGLAAVDLVLVPTLTQLGVPDQPLFVALLALATSLVFLAWSLFVSFVKRELGIVAYGKVHRNLVFVALLSGDAAVTATFWHVSSRIGWVFLILSITAFFGCAAYLYIARTAIEFLRQQQAALAGSQEGSTGASESERPGIRNGLSPSGDK